MYRLTLDVMQLKKHGNMKTKLNQTLIFVVLVILIGLVWFGLVLILLSFFSCITLEPIKT